jgi:hypothetical protein
MYHYPLRNTLFRIFWNEDAEHKAHACIWQPAKAQHPKTDQMIKYQNLADLPVQHYMYMFNRHTLPSGNAKFAGGHLYNKYHTKNSEVKAHLPPLGALP